MLGTGKIAFNAADEMSIEYGDITAHLTVQQEAITPAIPDGLKIVKLNRAEMERLFARGTRRTLEVIAPSAKLTEPRPLPGRAAPARPTRLRLRAPRWGTSPWRPSERDGAPGRGGGRRANADGRPRITPVKYELPPG